MFRSLAALVFIFLCTSFAWLILGATIFARTYRSDPGLRSKVESSWGSPQRQSPPKATYSYQSSTMVPGDGAGKPGSVRTETSVVALPLESSHVDVDLKL